MDSTITTVNSRVVVTDVVDVQVTEKTLIDGVYLRAVQVFGKPEGTNALPVFTLVLKSDDATSISITSPESDF